MGRQIVHRLLVSFPALLGVLFLCFCLLQVVPADPAMIIAGPDAKADTIAAIRLELGLDRPIPIQFADYIYPGFDQIVSELAKMRWRSGGDRTCRR